MPAVQDMVRATLKEKIKLQTCALKTIFLVCDALRDLVAFVQFKKREKHP